MAGRRACSSASPWLGTPRSIACRFLRTKPGDCVKFSPAARCLSIRPDCFIQLLISERRHAFHCFLCHLRRRPSCTPAHQRTCVLSCRLYPSLRMQQFVPLLRCIRTFRIFLIESKVQAYTPWRATGKGWPGIQTRDTCCKRLPAGTVLKRCRLAIRRPLWRAVRGGLRTRRSSTYPGLEPAPSATPLPRGGTVKYSHGSRRHDHSQDSAIPRR